MYQKNKRPHLITSIQLNWKTCLYLLIMKIYVFGNGNINLNDFIDLYKKPLDQFVNDPLVSFILCEFRGVDTLMHEFLKSETEQVSIYHVGEKPRYKADQFKTKVSSWKFIGGFESDEERDNKAIEDCTHFLAYDFNSDAKRKSGTLKNIEKCISLGKIDMKETIRN